MPRPDAAVGKRRRQVFSRGEAFPEVRWLLLIVHGVGGGAVAKIAWFEL